MVIQVTDGKQSNLSLEQVKLKDGAAQKLNF